MRPGNKKIEAEEEVGHQPGEDAESCDGPALACRIHLNPTDTERLEDWWRQLIFVFYN